MDPNTSEATAHQLDLACVQGEAYGRALEHMVQDVAADGGEQVAGHYLVGFAVEEAEGMYVSDGGRLTWREPGDDNLHLEITVRDAADGRFVPAVTVHATLIGPSGEEIGPFEQPLIWHPMLYHYGRNWNVPADGEYTLRVRVEPPRFLRHDEINGRRFTDPVDVEFSGVRVHRGRD
ncbi:MAG TPA: iron transporter [Solirubrobacteraceae bacterium]|nr:iron transporter [Solirubrobacteraceae bacterium]